MHVWLVTIGEPLSLEGPSRQLRTAVFADYLKARGHQVTWITSKFDHYAKRYFTPHDSLVHEGIRYEFLNGPPYGRNISLARLRNHREIARDFTRRVRAWDRPDIVISSFPPIELCDSVSAYCAQHGIPCVIDIRDLWPDELITRCPAPLRGIAQFLTAPMERAVERTMRRARSIVGVSRTYLDWGLRKAGRPAGPYDCLVPLGYADSAAARGQRKLRAGASATRATVNFFFAGAFNNSVDLDVVLAAFKRMPDRGISATLAGRGDKLALWTAAAHGDARVDFPGWVDPPRLAALAESADVGLVCYKPESLVAMPNKVFEYMSFGLPIINSIPGEAAQMIEAEGIGLNYTAGDEDGFVRCLATLAEDRDLRERMGRKSAALFEARYTSQEVYSRYAGLVERIAAANLGTAG